MSRGYCFFLGGAVLFGCSYLGEHCSASLTSSPDGSGCFSHGVQWGWLAWWCRWVVRVGRGQPQMWSRGVCDVICSWFAFPHMIHYPPPLPVGSVPPFQFPSALVPFPSVSAHPFSPVSNFPMVPSSLSSVVLDSIYMPPPPPPLLFSPVSLLFFVVVFSLFFFLFLLLLLLLSLQPLLLNFLPILS